MYYGEIKFPDIANGVGVRVSLFVSGCTHRCEGCFNPQTWNFYYGKEFTAQTEEQILELLSNSFVDGLTLLGGEPMEGQNQQALLPLLRRIKRELPEKTVWCYSGYTWEQLCAFTLCERAVTEELLSYLDILVDGEFVLAKKRIDLQFRGSENQRIIDVKQTLSKGEIVLWEGLIQGK